MALTTRSLSGLGRALLAALAFTSVGAGLQAAGSRYYVNDHLATTVGIADASGEIAALEADAFGSPLAASEAPNRYTGKPYDADMGAFVFPFRNYRADEGRWMTADPSGFPDGLNSAVYAAKPAVECDPLGLKITYSNVDFGAQSVYYLAPNTNTISLSFTGKLDFSWNGTGTVYYSMDFYISTTHSSRVSDHASTWPKDDTQPGVVWNASKTTGSYNYPVGSYKITIEATSTGGGVNNSEFSQQFSFEVKRE